MQSVNTQETGGAVPPNDPYAQFEFHPAAPRHHHYSFAWRYLPHLLASFVLEGYVLESVVEEPQATSKSASPKANNNNNSSSSSSGWGSDSGRGDDSILTSDVEGVAGDNWGSSCSSLHYEVPGGTVGPAEEADKRKQRLRRKHQRRNERKEKALKVVREQTASFAPESPSGTGAMGAHAGMHLNEEVNDYWSSSDSHNQHQSSKFTKNLEKRFKRQMEHSDKLRLRSQAIIDSVLTPDQRARVQRAHELQAAMDDGAATPLLGNASPVTSPLNSGSAFSPSVNITGITPNKSVSRQRHTTVRVAADEHDNSIIPRVAELTLRTILYPLDKECLTSVMSHHRHKLRLFGFRYSRREARELYVQELDQNRSTLMGAIANLTAELSRTQDQAARDHLSKSIAEKESSVKDTERMLVNITMFEVAKAEYFHARRAYKSALAQLPSGVRAAVRRNRRNPNKSAQAIDTPLPANFPSYPVPPLDPVSPHIIDTYRSKGFHLEVPEIRQRIDSSRLPLFVVNPPSISLADYYCRLMSTMKCSPECYLWSLCLIQKIAKLKRVLVTSRSIHRLVLASVVVSAKMRDDRYYANPHYAAGGTVSREDMRAMEKTFCSALGFDCNVSPLEYLEMVLSLRQHCSGLFHYKSVGWASDAWKEILAWIPLPDVPRLRGQFVEKLAYHGNPVADRQKERVPDFDTPEPPKTAPVIRPVDDRQQVIADTKQARSTTTSQAGSSRSGRSEDVIQLPTELELAQESRLLEERRRLGQYHSHNLVTAPLGVMSNLPQRTSDLSRSGSSKNPVDDSYDSALGLTSFQVLTGPSDVASPMRNAPEPLSITSIGMGVYTQATGNATSFLSSGSQSLRFQHLGTVQHHTAGMPGPYQMVSGVAGASQYEPSAASTTNSFGVLSPISTSSNQFPSAAVARGGGTSGPTRSVLPQLQPTMWTTGSESSSSANTPVVHTVVPNQHVAGGGYIYAHSMQKGSPSRAHNVVPRGGQQSCINHMGSMGNMRPAVVSVQKITERYPNPQPPAPPQVNSPGGNFVRRNQLEQNQTRRSAPSALQEGGGLSVFTQPEGEDHTQFSPPPSLDTNQQQALRVFSTEDALRMKAPQA